MKYIIAICAFLFAGSLSALPPNNTSTVIIDSQAAIERSATSCNLYTGGTTTDVWVNRPAEIDTSIIWQIRYIEIHNVTESATPFATGYVSGRLGPLANSPALSLTSGWRIFGGASRQFQLRRPNTGATIGQPFPLGPVTLRVLPQSDVTLCVTYYW